MWVTTVAITLASFLFALLITKNERKNAGNAIIDAFRREDQAALRKLCEDVFSGKHMASTKRFAARLYARAAADAASSLYERALPYLKPEEQTFIIAVYAMRIGDFERALTVIERNFRARKAGSREQAYELACAVCFHRGQYERCYRTAAEGIDTLPRGKRDNLAAKAFQAAYALGNEAYAREAVGRMSRRRAAAYELKLDTFHSRQAGKANPEQYVSALLSALYPKQKKVFFCGGPHDGTPFVDRYSYLGGAYGYDTKALKKQRATFIGQIHLKELFPEEKSKHYALRFWMSRALSEGGEGVYRGEDVTVLKQSGEKYDPFLQKELPSQYTVPAQYMLFAPSYMYLFAASAVTGQAAAEANLLPPAEAIGEAYFLDPQNINLTYAFGYPCLNAEYEALTAGYGVCLFQFPLNGYRYAFLMTERAFAEDDYSDVIAVKQENFSN